MPGDSMGLWDDAWAGSHLACDSDAAMRLAVKASQDTSLRCVCQRCSSDKVLLPDPTGAPRVEAAFARDMDRCPAALMARTLRTLTDRFLELMVRLRRGQQQLQPPSRRKARQILLMDAEDVPGWQHSPAPTAMRP